MERSMSTFPQTHIFYVPNILDLAQTVLTWEAKIVAVADVDMADVAETNWKHKSPQNGVINKRVVWDSTVWVLY